MLDGMEKIKDKSGIAPLRNVQLLRALINKVQYRGADMPGMACFYGFSGYGKSKAALYNAYEDVANACWIQIKSVWTRKDLTLKICKGLAIPAGRTVSENVERIGEELVKSCRPLLLDEAHLICTDSMMKMLHDIYESSNAEGYEGRRGTAIILIGEELLPQQLRKYERIHNRLLDRVPAQPADLREVGLLAQLRCPRLQISEEVLERVLIESRAVARRIVSNLNQIADYARIEGKSDITGADAGSINWINGEVDPPRGGVE